MSVHETAGDGDGGLCPHGPEFEAAPELCDYETGAGAVVIFDAEQPLGWIEIDPDALVEVRHGDE